MKPTIILLLVVLFVLTYCIMISRKAEPAQARKWQGIVVHHSGSDYDSYKSIDAYHRSRGWDCCGYHYVLEKDGRMFEGRPLSKIGAHAKTSGPDRNKSHIGICLCGTDDFTYKQRMVLHDLCERLAREFSIKSIERHHSQCPGRGINIEVLQEEIFAGI